MRSRSSLFVTLFALLIALHAISPPAAETREVVETEQRSCGVAPLLTPLPPSTGLGAIARPKGGPEAYRVVNRFHIVRRADGSGGIDESVIPLMLNDLNTGFRDTPFYFVREPGVTYIDDSNWYLDVPDFATQIAIVNEYRAFGVLNWFIVPLIAGGTSPAGTWVGPPYTSGARGIFMAYDNMGTPTNIVTPPHEVGHMFGLAHPYEVVFGNECSSGANCVTAGDRICDTPASPLLASHNTTGTGIYFGTEVPPCPFDPPYAPLTRLYMGAGWAAGHILRNSFTPGQIAYMMSFGPSQQHDLFGSIRPEVLVDCNADGLDDPEQILAGELVDLGRDMVPDACQAFPQPDDLLVCGMNSQITNRPRFYDGKTGQYRGDIWNGLSWTHSMDWGDDGLVYMTRLTMVDRFDVRTGRTVDNFVDGVLEGAGTFVDLLFDANRDLLVLDNLARNIRRYNGVDGSFMGVFANVGATGMTSPKAMAYGPDGNINVLASGSRGNTIQRFSSVNGAPLGSLILTAAGGLANGQGIVLRDGVFYVSNGAGRNVLKYNATTGSFLGSFVGSGVGGLNNPHGLRFGPDGDLYVASRGTHSVKRFDGTTGTYKGEFVTVGSGGSPATGGLNQPADVLFCTGAGAVVDLTLDHAGEDTTLSWTVPAAGAPLLRFDTIGSTTPADFADVATSGCVETDGDDTTTIDDDTPFPGETRYYLVRPENVCGAGPAGADSDGAERLTRNCTS